MEWKVWCTSICSNRECPKRMNHAAEWRGPCGFAPMKGTEDCPMHGPRQERRWNEQESQVRMDECENA